MRITQTYSKTPIPLVDALQLPGFEWDIKTGAYNFEPFWCSRHPAEYTTFEFEDYPYIQIDFLSGTVGTTFEITIWYNTKNVNYHYFSGMLPAEFENLTLETDEGIEMQIGELDKTSPIIPDPMSEGSSLTSRRWNYVDTITVDTSISAINIPVNARLFGKWPSREVARYSKWRGNLRVKVMTTNTTLLNGNIHLIHHNFHQSQALGTPDFRLLLGDISHSVNGAPGTALELDLVWRSPQPYMSTDSYDNRVDLGWLTIAIPASSNMTFAGASYNHTFTIYSDISALEFDLPRHTTVSGNWHGIEYSTNSREVTTNLNTHVKKKDKAPFSLSLN